MINYGSVCSGIEAASVAWDGLGWKAAWFAEIEKFPAAVLAHHYPDVPNLGDMTKIAAGVRAGSIPAPAVMVGGTPCQAFSIAGLRKSLDDPRGQLTLSYVDLANAIDEKRIENGEQPAVHLWENVPGSLSTPDNAFGFFLAGMAGEHEAFEPGPRPERGKSGPGWRWNKSEDKHVQKWPKSGCVYGRQRRIAWRLLDAKYFGVAQRRRRLFVIASARNDIDPAEILFEFDSMRRDSSPCREETQAAPAAAAAGAGTVSHQNLNQPGKGTTATVTASSLTGGTGNRPESAVAGHFTPVAFGGGNCAGALEVAACLTARGQRNDFDVETFAVQGDGQLRVRRLTPKECERLQGFPDGWTLIPEKKRNALTADELAYLRLMHPDMPEEEAHRQAADGPRYKAIGNSMAVPVMHWIGDRIANQIMLVASETDTRPATLPALPATKKKRAPARKVVEDKYPRSFLKWAGGKHSVLDEILAVMPAGKRLIEPFVGSGSVFINAGFKRNLLGDINPDLINLFNQLQGNPDAVINTAHQLEKGCFTNEAYVAMRNEFNGRQAHAMRHASLFLALMRTCFNGLCRYNLKGLFNVGWNKKAEKNYFPLDELQHFAGLQKEMTFVCAGFEDVIGQAGEGDVIFCDPPYEPMPDESGFTAYSGNAFTFEHQTRLVECLVAARSRGAKVVITNSSAPSVVDLYTRNGFRIMPLAARRSVSCKADTRKTADDIIAVL
ncbi:Dam family site-specific DNA-(adenine-N6)-methyltransferase [Pantoea eucrina]|uniref:Dam family site-specific DNA-(adenine-N6)-methyltransferase n=1 Tax=Pantoea eucrina TaxID=472693 RepID=UPI002FDA83FF